MFDINIVVSAVKNRLNSDDPRNRISYSHTPGVSPSGRYQVPERLSQVDETTGARDEGSVLDFRFWSQNHFWDASGTRLGCSHGPTNETLTASLISGLFPDILILKLKL